MPQDDELLTEYERGWSIVDAMNQNGDPAPGIVTTHDEFAISWTREEAITKVERFLATTSEDEARSLWRLCSQSQWNYARAKEELASGDWRERVVPILYRPFDVRWTVYDRNVAVHRRERVMNHMLKPNLSVVVLRQAIVDGEWNHAIAATTVSDNRALYSAKSIQSQIPLWLYEGASVASLFSDAPDGDRHANFSPKFLAHLGTELGSAPSAPDIFAYAYAVLYSPSYRARYGAFLKRDFPRVPLTSDPKLFEKLAALGRRLIDLHLMRVTGPNEPGFPIAGNNRADSVGYRDGRVYLNAEQYFDGVSPQVWQYHIGGYQVAQKWLKDRKGRMLTFDELAHYRRVIAALAETIEIQEAIDAAIPGWPLP